MQFRAALVPLFVSASSAQQTAWGQCGGEGWTGPTSCVAGYVCTFSSTYYSQCIPGASSTLVTSTLTTSGPSPTSSSPASGQKLKWFGADESGAEWGTAMPGTWGVDFIFPSTTAIDTLIGNGFNIFRVPFAMERMAVGSITAPLATAYLSNYSTVINHITSKGAYAVIDPHNYGRYNGAIISDVASFGTFWTNLATVFKGNSKVIFDTNNEYNTMDESLVFDLNQQAITSIRATGATSQYIFVEGNAWTGAWTWNTTNDSLKTLTDPSNLIVYEMHQYLDSDGSGTDPSCVSNTIGVERVEGATAWLQANNKLGVLGEYAGGENIVCQTAITGMLNHLEANSNVWLGALWWAGGPWWGTSTQYAYEPPSGPAYTYYNSLLNSYAP